TPGRVVTRQGCLARGAFLESSHRFAGTRRLAVSSPRGTFDATPGSTHELVVGLVPRGGRVLEFGCASGYMSEVLKDRRGCSVVGVELFAEGAERARLH